MSTRDELVDTVADGFIVRDGSWEKTVDAVLALLAERGMVVLGPDGEPLDVRPALRATARHLTLVPYGAFVWTATGMTRPLADACLAAAEVEP